MSRALAHQAVVNHQLTILLALLELETGTGLLAGLGVDKATTTASIPASVAEGGHR